MLNVAFPMPSEDPAFALNRVAWLGGHAASSANEHVPWPVATQQGVSLTAELDVTATRSVHALLRLIDVDGDIIAQGAIAIPLPWLETACTDEHRSVSDSSAAEDAVPFECALSRMGERVGSLGGQLTAQWAARTIPQGREGISRMLEGRSRRGESLGGGEMGLGGRERPA